MRRWYPVANACLEGKRSSDIVGRIGGEEFAMLLPETDLYQARIVADRICKAVAASPLKAHAGPLQGHGQCRLCRRGREHVGF